MERDHNHSTRYLSPRPQLPSVRPRKRIQLGKSSHPTRKSSPAQTTPERPATVAHRSRAHTKIIELSYCHTPPKTAEKEPSFDGSSSARKRAPAAFTGSSRCSRSRIERAKRSKS